ncbi:aminotransferase class I/II-fold pyridoxal phosphate-dependent enzyme [Coprococcus sp. AM25-15LB]|nr:aminotransferase class I/II-fold pyridoxal phosphate-dependent enzyme [Coprococcus sp. AM25-15LB]RJW08269.1 aminotransferase class I/II-fold pyridoxal phosphate-dependent enzyme [Coprococcus sp. AM25-4LB]
MRNPLAKKVVEIEPSGIRKFFDVVNEMKDAISLGVGEPDFDTPWRIREEGIYSLEKGRTFYTSNSGLKELKEEICNYIQRKTSVIYDPKSEVVVTVGGSEGIDIAMRAMLDPGDEVLIPQPSYVSYLPCAVLAGGVPVVIPLQNKNEFKLTREELEAAITPRTKILVLPFPNNPTGSIMTREDLKPIAEVVKEHDLFVISDEIYSELSYQGEHVSIAEFPGLRERTIMINGFSKGFAMTGWRLGYACGPAEIIEQMIKIHQFAIMCAPTNSQYAAIEGLRNCQPEVDEMREAYNQRRRFLMHEFRRIGLKCFEPYGAFYVFPDVSEFGMTSEEFATRFLEEERVAVVPGTAFGASGEGFIRISYAYSLEDLKVALGRLERFIERLREQKR